MSSVKVERLTSSTVSVTVGDRFVGHVDRGTVNFERKPGRMDSKTVWFAVTAAKVSNASHLTDESPWFDSQAEAVEWLVGSRVW